MASRYEVEVTIFSAKDLKNVNWRNGPTRPYAVVWVDPNNKCSTKVDEEGDTCPFWDQRLVIPLPGPIDGDSTLYIDVVHAGNEEGTKKLIGSARLKLRDVLDDVGTSERVKHTLTLKRPSGRPQGKVEVKVTILEPHYAPPSAHYASPYGIPPQGSRDYHAPPPYGNPYAPPPPPHDPYYSSAPPQGGYPYNAYDAPPAPYGQGSGGYYGEQEEKKKSKFGGMGTGLAVGAVAGVLGGLALAEGVDALEDHIVDEAAEKVEEDLGYDPDDF
ncbi:protein SRC2 homolog [Pistacia vera]|uniref:protein SRC2 homolog n=1 Tax=Pistacia vera TaxID=55513 RepID=UPI001263AF30|nr:protein SRC2 homolog [Pistacia vera]